MSVVGFETRSVEDTALLMSVGRGRRRSARLLRAAARGGCAWRPRPRPALPARVHGDVKRVVDETAGRLRALGHEVERDDPPYPLVSPATTRYLAGIAQDAAERIERPERLQRRTKGFVRMGARSRGRRSTGRCARTTPSGCGPSSSATTCSSLPVTAVPPVRAGAWEGLGAVRTLPRHGPGLSLRARVEPHRPARPSRCRSAAATTACRSACSSWAATARRRCCSRSPRSSRASCAGRTIGRLSPE